MLTLTEQVGAACLLAAVQGSSCAWACSTLGWRH